MAARAKKNKKTFFFFSVFCVMRVDVEPPAQQRPSNAIRTGTDIFNLTATRHKTYQASVVFFCFFQVFFFFFPFPLF